MYSIKDELSDYAMPLPFMDCDNAKRYFRTQLENNEFMSTNKNDFSIWYMGLFNTETGEINAQEPKLIERGFKTNGNEEMALPNTD